MDVVIFGGPRDGEVIPAPKGSKVVKFVNLENVQSVHLPASPFGNPVTVEVWDIMLKRDYWTKEEYATAVMPGLQKWLLESSEQDNTEGE